VGESIDKFNIGFLFAMNLHKAMRHVGPTRQELGQRTLFNILGPMLNPAGARRQLIGVFNSGLTLTLANVLRRTGSEHVMVVAGGDGLDEITLTAPTQVAELKNGQITEYDLTPESFGLARCRPEHLKGGSPNENAVIIRAILDGEKGPKRDITLLNAGAALYVGGLASSIQAGIALAEDAIQSGAARKTLDDFTAFSH
jgi:anthranilate phosphoribosyltransferase